MATPWHLELLGLPAHADALAVRRAYAVAMRQLDPETDPAGFARLREAYVEARAYCEEAWATAAETATPDALPLHDAPAKPSAADGVEAAANDDSSPPAAASPAVAVDHTVTLAWRFAADVGARPPETIAALLDDVVAELRMQYIDAPGQFEEHLIDLVGMQRIAQRAHVFAAAEARFHWNEVGHLAALDERGRWIEIVLAQRETWLAMDATRRSAWMDLLAHAEERLDTAAIRRWPEIQQLQERFPAWLSLHVLTETLEAWQRHFDALPPSMRQEYTQRAPDASAYLAATLLEARKAKERRSQWQAAATFVLALAMGALTMIFNASKHAPSATWNTMPIHNDTPAQCSEIYARLNARGDVPNARPVPLNELDELKVRGHRCALAGHWHAPAPGGSGTAQP